MNRGICLSALLVLVSVGRAGAQSHPAPKRVDIAEGIYLFMTPPYGEFGLDGNSVAIVTGEGVLVFDSNGTPAAAENVLAEIRKLTAQPVKYLVNSHWHWDHWYGAEVYKKAFPDVVVITQEKSRLMMAGPAIEFNRPFLEKDFPPFVQSLEKRVADGEAASPPPANLPRLKQVLAQAKFFLDQKNSVRHTLAGVTFQDQMEIHLGGRTIQLMNFGRAVTPGDTVLYLPREKVLLVGDLIVNPVTFALGCYPSSWLAALEKIEKLDATTIITGHEEPLRDKELLRNTMEVMRILLREGQAAKTRGLDPDAAKAAILPQLGDLKAKITRNDPKQNGLFDLYLVDWYLHRVYDELAGPLTDAIAPPPRHP